MSRFSYKDEVYKLSSQLFQLQCRCDLLSNQLNLAALVAVYLSCPNREAPGLAEVFENRQLAEHLVKLLRECRAQTTPELDNFVGHLSQRKVVA